MFDMIAFDADDTLWQNESHYQKAKEFLSQLLSKYHGSEFIQKRLDDTELLNIPLYGYGIKGFALSMIETAIDLSEGKIEGSEIHRIIDISKEMLTNDVELFEHVEETLKKLMRDFDLMLITKGDHFEQERKIDRSGISKYFRYIEIVGEKSRERYQALLAKYKIPPERFVMIGNSLRSDIQPVLALGGRAVYIPNELTWFHEELLEEKIDRSMYDELETIDQLPEYLDQLMRAEAGS
jgi:putative hydrolase of the HAD superfamily